MASEPALLVLLVVGKRKSTILVALGRGKPLRLFADKLWSRDRSLPPAAVSRQPQPRAIPSAWAAVCSEPSADQDIPLPASKVSRSETSVLPDPYSPPVRLLRRAGPGRPAVPVQALLHKHTLPQPHRLWWHRAEVSPVTLRSLLGPGACLC